MDEQPKKSSFRDLAVEKDVKGGGSEHGGPERGQPHHPHPSPQWTGFKSSVNGTTFLRSGLFVFLMGQCSLAAVGLAVFFITIGGLSERFLQLTNRTSAIEAIQSRMDEKGTNFSHYGIQAD